MKYILLILLSSNIIWGQVDPKESWNHHVHLFSPQLLKDLRSEKSGSEFLNGPDVLYSDIDTLMSKVKSDKIALISTGYGYRKENKTIKELEDLVRFENDYLFKAHKKYEQRIFPFIGIDPTQLFALDEIKRCNIKFDYYGIKLHFHSSKVELLNINDINKIKPIFEYARKLDIPLLIHFKNHKQEFGYEQIESFFVNFTQQNQPLTIIFAHSGGDGMINEKTKEIVKGILKQNVEFKQNIYFEISTAIWDKYIKQYELTDSEKKQLLHEIGFDKLLYGTDYPARQFDTFPKRLKHRLKFTEEEFTELKTNCPLEKYAR